jgi:hypothetical protein
MAGKSSWRNRAGVVLAAVISIAGGLVVSAPAADAAPNLWVCRPFTKNLACTVVTSAPAGGVQVLDRQVGHVVTWPNGTSVALDHWYTDFSHQCGINGDDIVWRVVWRKPDGRGGFAYIGDYYLATGPESYWENFAVDNYPLSQWNDGLYEGPCDTGRPTSA